MRFFSKFALLFYIAVILFVGIGSLYFVGHSFFIGDGSLLEQLNFILNEVYSGDIMLKANIALGALALIMLNFMFARIISFDRQKEKGVLFNNPLGEVSVSLKAIEDLVRRLIAEQPEVKEVSARIAAKKGRLDVQSRLVLNADVSIPEITSRLQDLVKGKIQNIINPEEEVTVRIHVAKIIVESKARVKTEKKKSKQKEEKPEITIPYQGFRG